MITCPTCHKACKTTQGLSAHRRLTHSNFPAPRDTENLESVVTEHVDEALDGLQPENAQELPAEPILTPDEFRDIFREELDLFSTEVLRIPATMGQKQTAFHPVGLCDDGRCQPCRAQRNVEHSQARKILTEEFDQAIRYKGRRATGEMIRRDGADGLAEVFEEWRDAGRPEDEQIIIVR